MVAYSFKKQFVDPILAGTKRQTIRAERKRHARLGEEMQLYSGMRTKHCSLIRRAVCETVASITLDFPGNSVTIYGAETLRGWLSLDEFARNDGFDGWLELREFWLDQHPGILVFTGVMIRWHA